MGSLDENLKVERLKMQKTQKAKHNYFFLKKRKKKEKNQKQLNKYKNKM